jgi:hypothetical protein
MIRLRSSPPIRRAAQRRLPLQTLARCVWPVLMAVCAVGTAAAAARDADEKPADEIEVKFPAFPQPENLIPFVVSATTDNEFMVDGESLNVSGNGVVRFTLVIVSPSGARNVSYEGINCATGERRLYAFGRSDGTWSKARNDQWTRIAENTLNRHHAALFTEYFCPVGATLRDADDARRALRSGGHPSTIQR